MTRNILTYIIFSLAIILFFSSCKKSYLDTAPTNIVLEKDALATTDGCWKLLNGVHRILYSSQLGRQDMVGQGSNMMVMDLMGEDITLSSTNDWFLYSYLWLNSHRSATSINTYFNYFFYYQIINNVNLLIDNVSNATGSDADKNAILGQAYAYRAWSYYQMIQLYGIRYNSQSANTSLGLRITLHNQSEVSPRASVDEVYTQINSDIDKAISLLGGYKRANKSHIDLSVALGMKARISLTQQHWSDAANYANQALASYQLMDSLSYMSGFNDYTNAEWMWGSHQQDDQTTYFASFFAYMSCNFPSLNIIASPRSINDSIYRLIAPSDVRWQLWDSTGTNTNFPIPATSDGTSSGTRVKFMQRKFKVKDASSSIGDIPLMRAAEMYLIKAEALSQLGKDIDAANALYTLAKKRNNSYVLSTNRGIDLKNEIQLQRRIELWGEGFGFYDLKRWNKGLDRNRHSFLKAYQKNVPAGDIKWQFLIPQSEINATNGVIEQNPL